MYNLIESIMNTLNDPDSEIFKKTLIEQERFITQRFSKMKKNRYLDDRCSLVGSKEDIAKHLNLGPAQNLIQSFFNYKIDKCSYCNGVKGLNGIRQFERAHCNNYSRNDILIMALDELYLENKTPIKVGDILKLFIKKHSCCPIYMLCNKCHNIYDNGVF